MSENDFDGHRRIIQRTSSTPSNLSHSDEDSDEDLRANYSSHVRRHLSTVSQIYLPGGDEYRPQKRVPPIGPEIPKPVLLQTTADQPSMDVRRRVSIITPIHLKRKKYLDRKTERILFLIEPVLCGFILFPIIVLFWESGWNLAAIILNLFNNLPPNAHLNETITDDTPTYRWQSLIYPYLTVQLILLLYYLCQDLFYNLLKTKNRLLKMFLLKCHIYILSTLYIIQWIMLWTIWDEYIPHQWYFELSLSFTALFALIVFNGHLADLVCSPFLFSYDFIEYCIHFGCPLLTKQMKTWKINLINYVSYEIIVSNLSVMSWRGFYHFADEYLYPNNLNLSSGISIFIGYFLYLPLMYFQNYLEDLHMKYEFWTFISINFPQFYRNIRHLLHFSHVY